MNSLEASVKKISWILKKDVDILDRMGSVICSSNKDRLGMAADDMNSCSMPVDPKCRFYIRVEGGSKEETAMAALVVQDKVHEGTADICQQFLINIMEGSNVPEGYLKGIGMPDGDYMVYCISLPSFEHFHDACSLITNSFYGDDNKWVLPFDDDILVVKKVDSISDDVRHDASMIKDMINTELYTGVAIGVGNIHRGVLSIKKSLDEAMEAIRLGNMFSIPGNIYVLNDMLIERLVSQIPPSKAEELAQGMVPDGLEDIFDDEMLKTVEVFYKNNLNISDSSRILYIHRNTLLYRLDKIQKATGLDIRKFEDAVVLKICLLLKSRRII